MPKRYVTKVLILFYFGLWLPADSMGAAEAPPEIEFNRDIRPILSEKCFQCHGPDSAARQAGLRLDLPEGALEVIQPGQVDVSELIDRITTTDLDQRMPPESSEKMLSDQEQELLVAWVRQGAVYQPHWSFLPPERPPLPQVELSSWPANEIDLFVLQRLERAGATPSPAADRVTLIRRVTLELTGLPPTPGEVGEFVNDTSNDAYERLIDRLLDSERYGEQMAVYWLEASRYADTDGYQNDRTRHQHVWRDWVIMAFNENQPYDQFVIQQVAGDMLPGATLRQQIATGFCRNHRINSEDGSIPQEWHVENVVDRVDTVGTVFLGLTLSCARCHDHKFDPISQKEYYRLFAYFNNVPEWGVGPNGGNSPPYVEVPPGWPHLTQEEEKFYVPEAVKLRREEEEGSLLDRPQAGDQNTVMVMHELPEPRPTYRLQRGQYNLPDRSERLQPGVPQALLVTGTFQPGNRLELARWLVDSRNPLAARVAVNRLWQQLFGVGLIKTSENFGTQGELPRHPELLDWLATNFVDGGWDVKAFLKTILLSSTYRQSSRISQSLAERDPENRQLARGPRFRLTAFIVRDQALAVSGLLIEQQGGRSVKPYMPPKIWRSISNNEYEQEHGDNLYRRSLYTYWRRTIPPPTMTNFNAASREVCVVRKDRTNTPLQALTLMNNVAFVECSRFLAERMMREGGQEMKSRVEFGFRLAMGRPPSSDRLASLMRACQSFQEHYQGKPDSAKLLLAVGEKPRDESLDGVQHAAMTLTASLILNLDEVITKE